MLMQWPRLDTNRHARTHGQSCTPWTSELGNNREVFGGLVDIIDKCQSSLSGVSGVNHQEQIVNRSRGRAIIAGASSGIAASCAGKSVDVGFELLYAVWRGERPKKLAESA